MAAKRKQMCLTRTLFKISKSFDVFWSPAHTLISSLLLKKLNSRGSQPKIPSNNRDLKKTELWTLQKYLVINPVFGQGQLAQRESVCFVIFSFQQNHVQFSTRQDFSTWNSFANLFVTKPLSLMRDLESSKYVTRQCNLPKRNNCHWTRKKTSEWKGM